MVTSSSTLCYSAKWLGDKKIYFDSVNQSKPKKMLKGIHSLLSEADAVVSYNGKRFDLPTLNKEFLMHGMSPPAPYKQIDMLQVARGQFRFTSNKLDYVAQQLGLGKKVSHKGFHLWVDCMNGKPEAWKKMQSYNKKDVVLLEKLYNRMLPWVPNHPVHGLYNRRHCCPKCGSKKYQRRGVAITKMVRYERLQCSACGSWFKGDKAADHMKPAFTNLP